MRSTRSGRLVTRLATFDVPGVMRTYLPKWLTVILFSFICFLLTLGARLVIDHLIVPGGGTYAVAFPAIVAAALFGGWQCGLLTLAFTIGHAWFVVMPAVHYLGMPYHEQLLRMMVNVAYLLIVLALAEVFRRAVHIALAERDQRIADMDLFLSEFDHRTKNAFASVTALLELQKKRVNDEAAAQALGEAKARIESMARAHLHLYRDGSVSSVDAQTYLHGLCDALGDSHLPDGVTLHCEADNIALDRDRAISLGLIANELVTNAAKHAFVGRHRGRVDIALTRQGDRLRLKVDDDGVGSETFRRDGGLGVRLIDAFVRQVEGKLTRESDARGSRFLIEMPL